MTAPIVLDGKAGELTRIATGSTAEGIRVIRCHGLTLYAVVEDCAGAGILDYGTDGLTLVNPNIRRNGRGFVADSSGRDTQGSGIIVQGSGTEISGGYVADNGNETTLEHGIYVSKLARGCTIHATTILRNAASGLKLDGEVVADRLVIAGSPRGVVLGINADGAELLDSDITGTTYAVMAEKGAVYGRFSLDDNRYARGSKFRLADGRTVVDLAGWKKATGLDAHSVEVPW